MNYRINGFDQIKSFYSIVFEQKHEIKPQHISLYCFFINQNNRNNWVEWFKCPYDLAMAGACIGNKKTYYKCLSDLQDWGFIKYEKGVNEWKAPKIKLEVLKCTSTDTATVPQGTPLLQQLHIPLPEPLPTQRYKQVTNNLKQLTSNTIILVSDNIDLVNKKINEWIRIEKDADSGKNYDSKNTIPNQDEFIEYGLSNKDDACPEKLRLKYLSWKANNWRNGKDKEIKNWKTSLLNTLPFLEKEKKVAPKKEKGSTARALEMFD